MEAKGFVPKLERLLLTVDESNNAKLATRIAGLIAGGGAMPTTVMHIKSGSKTGKAADAAAKQTAEELGKTVQEFAQSVERVQKPDEKTDVSLDVTTIVEKAPKPEAVAEEAEKGYSLMIVGLEKTVARRGEFHDDVTKLASGFEGPLAVIDGRGRLLAEPLHESLNMLVPINGTENSRRAAEVAIAIARVSHAPLTALYVAPGGRKRSRRYEEAILKDIVKLAETYDLDLRTAVRANVAADEAILKELSRKEYNLVVVGAGRRPGEKLFFGDTAATLLEKSKQSLLFVASEVAR
jgi:nucleotide-binding universal stress UspA family protein